MSAILAKLTSKNQLTLPQRIVDRLDHPTHFEITVAQGVLLLFPGRIVSLERQGEAAGIPPDVLREARRLVMERKARQQAESAPVTAPDLPGK